MNSRSMKNPRPLRAMPILLRLALPLAALPLTALLVGCSRSGTPALASTPAKSLEPPYRIDPDAPDRLIVRADLLTRLKSTPAELSRAEARLIGNGRVGFAADAAYAVKVPVDGYVKRVLVGPGDAVIAGQPLAELRSGHIAQLRADHAQASVQVRAGRQGVARLKPLVEDGTGTARALAEATAGLQIAEAELASIQQSLATLGATLQAADGHSGDHYVLQASTAGSVIRRSLAPGERVGPDDKPAFLIGDVDRLVIRAAFPERDARLLKEGATCVATIHALAGERFAGTVAQVIRAVDPGTRSAEALCVPAQRGQHVTAEMVARVEVEVQGDERLMIPRSALLMRQDHWVVFTRAAENAVERRRVKPGVTLGDQVEILEGIRAGDAVVFEGAILLDGALDLLI